MVSKKKLKLEIKELEEQVKSTRRALDVALEKMDKMEKDFDLKINNISGRIQNEYKKSQEERNTIIDEWLNGKKGEQ